MCHCFSSSLTKCWMDGWLRCKEQHIQTFSSVCLVHFVHGDYEPCLTIDMLCVAIKEKSSSRRSSGKEWRRSKRYVFLFIMCFHFFFQIASFLKIPSLQSANRHAHNLTLISSSHHIAKNKKNDESQIINEVEERKQHVFFCFGFLLQNNK